MNTEIPVIDRVWAAAFFAGEGCISTNKLHNSKHDPTSVSMQPRLTVAQKADGEKILTKVNEALGNLGRLYHRKTRATDTEETWLLCIEGFEKVQTAVGIMWPYLTDPKKADFKRVIKECSENFRAKPEPVRRQSINRALAQISRRQAASV